MTARGKIHRQLHNTRKISGRKENRVIQTLGSRLHEKRATVQPMAWTASIYFWHQVCFKIENKTKPCCFWFLDACMLLPYERTRSALGNASCPDDSIHLLSRSLCANASPSVNSEHDLPLWAGHTWLRTTGAFDNEPFPSIHSFPAKVLSSPVCVFWSESVPTMRPHKILSFP